MINRRHLVSEQKILALLGISVLILIHSECILGGLIDQRLASGLIEKLFSFGLGYEFSCKFSTGA